MNSDDRERIERALIRRLDNVNGWLKFAETKNAGLLAFSGAILVAIAGYVGSADDIPARIELVLIIAAGTLMATAVVALASFLPILNPSRARAGMAPDPQDNLEYFGHLLKHDAKTLTEEIARLYAASDPSLAGKDKLLTDTAHQIIVNSRIAHQKFNLFSWGLYIVSAGVLVAAVALGIREVV